MNNTWPKWFKNDAYFGILRLDNETEPGMWCDKDGNNGRQATPHTYANVSGKEGFLGSWTETQPIVKTEKPITEVERLRAWVADLQSGMFVNCVYCGHRYGPKDKVPVSMANALKLHIAECPEHPISNLLKVCKKIRRSDLKDDDQPFWDEIQAAISGATQS